MKRILSLVLAAAVLSVGAFSALAFSSNGGGNEFDVTVTNLTRGQQFTPILVVSHKKDVSLFSLGQSVSDQLATLAETGDTVPLTELLMANPGVKDVVTVGPLLDPGDSRTITIQGGGKYKYLSLASMMIPTNDGFIALNGVRALTGKDTTYVSPGYDAGSEVNDELCASIPGPFFIECGGPGSGGAPGSGEGYVHINAGMHGIGDMDASERDWRNPVAWVSVEKVDGGDDDGEDDD